MTDNHLRNAIRMLERAAPALLNREQIACAMFTDSLNGEMAIEAASREMDALFDMEPLDWLHDHSEPYRNLLKEANRRSLQVHVAVPDERY